MRGLPKEAAGKRLSVDFLGPRAVMMNRLTLTAKAIPEKRWDLTLDDGSVLGVS